MKMAMITKKGGREENEDSIGRWRKDGIYCFVLADGLGGHGGGRYASEAAVQTVLNCFDAQAEVSGDIMYAYLEAAQNKIIELRSENPSLQNIGTTIAAVVTDGERAVIGHCGDSRIYRFKKNKIQEITDDHSVAFMSFMAGEIGYDEIRTSPDQNRLIRSLTDGSSFKPQITIYNSLDKHTSFLLCSDGFWEYVNEDYMEWAIKKSSSPKEWLELMLEERDENAPPDADNYSAICVFI